jgi:hypothetical protein
MKNVFWIETTPMIATMKILAANLHAEAYEDLYDGTADWGGFINLVILVAIIAAALGILRLLGALLEWIELNRKLTPAERVAVIEGLKAHGDEVVDLTDQESVSMSPLNCRRPAHGNGTLAHALAWLVALAVAAVAIYGTLTATQ